MSHPAFTSYIKSISQALAAGNATEHTHRPALKTLIEGLAEGVIATNEPKRIACGAPDFIVGRGSVPLGYVEAKDVGVGLAEVERGEQLTRYRASLRNLILTDYLEFRYYRNGELVQSARIASIQKNGSLKRDADGMAQLETLFSWFFAADIEGIASPRELAGKMAALARMIHDLIIAAFGQEEEGGDLHGQFEGFRQVLIADLSPDQFADMYAQTICYGLFAARCNHGPGDGAFTRQAAVYQLPRTNPFLRDVFSRIAGVGLDERIAWAVDDLALLLARADIGAILENFGRRTRQEDPVVHFYETFLAAYDPRLRQTRGVYYTPEPVVSYIVRSVDALLKGEFGLADGLADAAKVKVKLGTGKTVGKKNREEKVEEREVHRVQVLDPATGTGTFLHAVVDLIRGRFAGNAGMWPGYVAEHLLPRLYGFELLIAPYAVAHMKLGLQLKESGYDFASDERLRVFLTNTLEEAHELAGLPLFAQVIAREAASAGAVKKEAPIMVVLGNPPYSGHSANTGAWIAGLLRGEDGPSHQATGSYFQCDGQPLGERNPKWLNDDYVKFIRFAQWRIERTGYGILAFVTNHGYLDNPTFRGMRQSLMASFDDLYLLDLHGNSKKKEKSPDGGVDENVFDIQQGVAIALFVKRPGGNGGGARVRYHELWGRREGKYDWLWAHDVADTPWATLAPAGPAYLFTPQEAALAAEYSAYWKITEAMPVNVLGFQSHRDGFAVDFDRDRLEARMAEMRGTALSDGEFLERHGLRENDGWQVAAARRRLRGEADWRARLIACAYRPFDFRWAYFDEAAMDRPRRELKDHVAGKENLCLNLVRQTRSPSWQHALVSDTPTPAVFVEVKDGSSLFPLYLYPTARGDLFAHEEAGGEPSGRRANLAPAFVADLSARLGLAFVPDGRGDLEQTFGPEDVFHYAYAVFHAPGYRLRYAQFLKNDFPRLPLTGDRGVFRCLAGLGRQLAALHLMREFPPEISRYPVAGSNRVEAVSFESDAQRLVGINPPGSTSGSADQGRVYINKEQYFEGVPSAVWQTAIGGYQVCQKWLKDRKGRLLSFDDIRHYHRIVAALCTTREIQAELDLSLSSWPPA